MPDVAELARHYEDLRSEVTDVRVSAAGGLGLTLLMTRGLSAWMKARAVCMPAAERCERAGEAPPLLPVARPDVVQLLTGMALAACTEAES